MQLSFTEKKNIRKSFGKLTEALSIPNLIEVQKNSYKELTEFNPELGDLGKGFDRVFKSIFPIEDLNDKATLEYVSYRFDKPKFDTEKTSVQVYRDQAHAWIFKSEGVTCEDFETVCTYAGVKPTAVRNFASNVINSGDIINVRRKFQSLL